MFVRASIVASGDAETAIARGRLQPVAWSPASSLWGRLLNFEADRALVADENPSIARTPLVIAMWEPMTQALGYPKKPLGFDDILRLARSNQGWAAYGRPEFGRFKLVHTNPDFSTAGLSAVVAEYYAATGKREGLRPADITGKARATVRDIERSIVHYGDTTLFISDEMRKRGPGYASAVAMEEATLVDFNRRRGSRPKLVAIYPKEGTFYSDNPFIVLDGDWVSAEQKEGAQAFQRFLAEKLTPEVTARAGFRPADLDAGRGAAADRRERRRSQAAQRVLGLPEPRVLAQLKRSWRADRKPASVLLVLDTSGSMAEENRLENAKQGLRAFLKEAAPQDRIGLTIFNDRVEPLIPVGAARRRTGRSCADTVDRLIAEGGTAVYDATSRGFQDVKALGAGGRPHQRRRGADRRRGHRLLQDRRRRRRRARPGRRRGPRARVHDRLQRGRGGRQGGARQDRRGVRRQVVHGQHEGHRVRLPLDQLVLLMPGELEPYGRGEFRNALIANAAAKPFNVAVLVGVMGAGVALSGNVCLCLFVALVVYAAACARTFFDGDEADRVLARERGERRERRSGPASKLDLDALAAPIRLHVMEARSREQRIRAAIDRAELPYEEVSDEVDGFVRVMESTAARAQMLSDALADTPVARVEARLTEVRARPGGGAPELIDALEHQLAVQRRMEAQLERFYDEMERIVVELDTVRGTLVSLSASTDAGTQRELASEVRSLRERMGAVADGISEAYEQPSEA